jgi:hypothetical protein
MFWKLKSETKTTQNKTKQLVASQNKDNKKFKQNSRKNFQARTQTGAQVRLGPPKIIAQCHLVLQFFFGNSTLTIYKL